MRELGEGLVGQQQGGREVLRVAEEAERGAEGVAAERGQLAEGEGVPGEDCQQTGRGKHRPRNNEERERIEDLQTVILAEIYSQPAVHAEEDQPRRQRTHSLRARLPQELILKRGQAGTGNLQPQHDPREVAINRQRNLTRS